MFPLFEEGHVMPTIIEYSDTQPPENRYPERIVSPRHWGACCATGMEDVSDPLVEGRWTYRYRRCRRCGFAVRLVMRSMPDAEAIASVRTLFEQRSFAELG
jgi:hypothetical protein